MFVCCCAVTMRCQVGKGGAPTTCGSLPRVCFSSCMAQLTSVWTAAFPFPWVLQLRHAWACTPCEPSSSPALWRCSARLFLSPLLKVCCAPGMQGVNMRMRTCLQTRGLVWCRPVRRRRPGHHRRRLTLQTLCGRRRPGRGRYPTPRPAASARTTKQEGVGAEPGLQTGFQHPARHAQPSTPRQTCSLPKTWLHDPSLAQRAPLSVKT